MENTVSICQRWPYLFRGNHRLSRFRHRLLVARGRPSFRFFPRTVVGKMLSTAFDVLWQTSGAIGSPNYDTDGNWKPRG